MAGYTAVCLQGWLVGVGSIVGLAAGLALSSSVFSAPLGAVYGVVTGGALVWLLRFPKSIKDEHLGMSQSIVKKRPSWISGVALGCWLFTFFAISSVIANGFQNPINTTQQLMAATLALAAGIGLWRMKKWGALLGIAYIAFVSILNFGAVSGLFGPLLLLVVSGAISFGLWGLWKRGELT